MLRLFQFGLFLLAIVSCKQGHHQVDKSKKADKPLVVLTYGLPNMDYGRAADVVARKYGFKYHAVAGCIVSGELVDSVKTENEKVYRVLANHVPGAIYIESAKGTPPLLACKVPFTIHSESFLSATMKTE